MPDLLKKSKDYLRIDGDFEDEHLKLLISAAEQYLNKTGVKSGDSDLYTLAVMMLVTHWYENREQVVGNVPNALAMGLQSIILQLKAGDLND